MIAVTETSTTVATSYATTPQATPPADETVRSARMRGRAL